MLGLLVLSHWVLDALSHRPDLPLWPGQGTMVGLGLWNSVPATLIVELAMLAAGVALYMRGRQPPLSFCLLVGFLLIAYFANAFGPPPPGVPAIAIVGLLTFFPALALGPVVEQLMRGDGVLF